MSIFVDSSGLFAAVSAADPHHADARRCLAELQSTAVPLVTTSYVLCETYALLQKRLGPPAVARMRTTLAPLMDVIWVDEELHEAGLDLLVADGRRGLSLVDAVSFAAMRRLRISRAFAFDPHFAEAGFDLLG